MNLVESWHRLSECIVPEASLAEAARPAGIWHALFSDRPRPLLLPAHHRRARRNSVRFFMPQLWQRAYAGLRLHAHDLFGVRAQLPSMALPPTASPTLSDRLAVTDSPQLAFLIGTAGPYQKASMLVMSSQGKPLALVKIALGASANNMVQTEIGWLKALNEHATLSDSVPRLLRAGVTRNGHRYFAQSIVGGNPDTGAFTAAHADFLRRLGEIDCRILGFIDSPVYAQMTERYERLGPRLSPAQRVLVHAALTDCKHCLADWRGPFVISHGDFAFWNIRTLHDSLCVFDWEYATVGTPPLFDLLHFHLIAPASSGRSLAARDMKRALGAAHAFARLTYAEFDWTPPILAGLGLAYLLHTLLFYGASRNCLIDTHPVIRSYCKLLEKRAAWLR